MDAESLRAWPDEPESEVEWEDLLFRLELMRKALNVELEGADRDNAETGRRLGLLADREAAVAAFLFEACHEESSAKVSDAQTVASQEDDVDRFMRLRARVFAMVQRRGIDVWRWRANWPGVDPPTVYQILNQLALEDTKVLEQLRGLRQSHAARC